MNDITPKEANEILSHYTDLGYGIVIEGEDTSKIKQALSLARKILANGTPYNPTGDAISRSWVNHNVLSMVDAEIRIYVEAKLNDASVVEERPQGEWIKIDEEWYDYKCSVCGEKVKRLYPFCHCGADMRNEADMKGGDPDEPTS